MRKKTPQFKVGDKVVYRNLPETLKNIRVFDREKAERLQQTVYGVVTEAKINSLGNLDLILDWYNYKGILIIKGWQPTTGLLKLYEP